MTLSSRKIHHAPRALAVAFLLALAACASAPPPTSELAAARAAVEAAEGMGPRGHAADALAEAQRRLDAANRTVSERKYDQARLLAEQAVAAAELAQARARLASARAAVDSKAARNADLRRQQLNSEER